MKKRHLAACLLAGSMVFASVGLFEGSMLSTSAATDQVQISISVPTITYTQYFFGVRYTITGDTGGTGLRLTQRSDGAYAWEKNLYSQFTVADTTGWAGMQYTKVCSYAEIVGNSKVYSNDVEIPAIYSQYKPIRVYSSGRMKANVEYGLGNVSLSDGYLYVMTATDNGSGFAVGSGLSEFKVPMPSSGTSTRTVILWSSSSSQTFTCKATILSENLYSIVVSFNFDFDFSDENVFVYGGQSVS